MNHPLLFIALAFTLHLSAQPAIITPEWTRFQAYDGNGTVGESPFALTDASGNVFFCGETYNPGPLIGMVTIKYSPDGTFLWESLFGTNAQDRVKSAVVDSDGHIYVACNTVSAFSGQPEFVLFKYDGATGQTLWTYRYESAGNSDRTYADELVMLPNGNIGLAATLYSSDLGISRILAISLAPQGDVVWQSLYENPLGSVGAFSARLDDMGHMVIWGGGTITLNSSGFLCHILDQNGNVVSTNLSAAYGDTFASGYHIDTKGNLYIGDYIGDYKVSKFNVKGELEWFYSKPHVTPPTQYFVGARLWAIQTDTAQNVFIGGVYYTDSIVGKDQYITMLDKSGNLMWEHILTLNSLNKGNYPYRATVTQNNLVAFAGHLLTNVGVNTYEPTLSYYNAAGFIFAGMHDMEGIRNTIYEVTTEGEYLFLCGISFPPPTSSSEPIKQFVSKIAIPQVSAVQEHGPLAVHPLGISPNPTNGGNVMADFEYEGPARSALANVVNQEGKVVASHLFYVQNGHNQVHLRCADHLPAGLYSVVIDAGTWYSGKLYRN